MRMMRRYVREKTVPIPRDEVWSLLSDTNHMHRVIRSFKLSFEGVAADEKGVYRKALTRLMGWYKVRWKEHPFEWRQGEYYRVLREYHNGPVRTFLMIVEFHDDGPELPAGGRTTRIVLDARVQSAGLLGDIVIPLTVHRQMERMFAYTLRYLQRTAEGKVYPVPQSRREYEVNTAELDRLIGELRHTAANPAYIPLVRDLLLHYDDDMVSDMRVYEWALKWGVDRDELLRFFLYGTQAGMFNLYWHLICPNCRVSKARSPTLPQLQSSYHCDFCGIAYESNLDKYIELCFTVHPAIRKADKQMYCIGGPAISPHILAQLFVGAQQTVSLPIPQGWTRYRLRVLQYNHILSLPYHPESEPEPVTYTSAGWPVEAVGYGDAHRTLTLGNDTDRDIVVALERDEWDDVKVTASKLGTMPEFRRMFTKEILAPGHEIAIESVTLLFSDLRGSTSFYEQVGDAPAYARVRRHFEFLERWIESNRGTIVKKIGDAVMAVFEKPEDGVKAALDIQRHVDEFNAASPNVEGGEADAGAPRGAPKAAGGGPHAHGGGLRADGGGSGVSGGEPIVIKIGVHHGPAIAVNADGRMDYFGRHVNIAARVQGLSEGRDVVISSSCMARAEMQELLSAMHVAADRLEATLRGIDSRQTVYRLRFI